MMFGFARQSKIWYISWYIFYTLQLLAHLLRFGGIRPSLAPTPGPPSPQEVEGWSPIGIYWVTESTSHMSESTD